MKLFLKALGQAKPGVSKGKIKGRPAPNQIKIKEFQITSNSKDFDDYFDKIVRENPNLDEKEMYDLYKANKEQFDITKSGNRKEVRLKNLQQELDSIRDKLMEGTVKDLEEAEMLHHRYKMIEQELLDEYYS